eukprot:568572-Prorocentrum_minimum.AAC.1
MHSHSASRLLFILRGERLACCGRARASSPARARHVLLPLHERVDALAQREQALVDGRPLRAALGAHVRGQRPLRSGEVDEAQLAHRARPQLRHKHLKRRGVVWFSRGLVGVYNGFIGGLSGVGARRGGGGGSVDTNT